MDTQSYIMLSRQLGLFRQMDTVANNVANSNTTGFKSQKVLFNEFLMGAKGNTRNSSFTYDVATVKDMAPGAITTTGRSMDAAINGKGFFAVTSPLGDRYTRKGSFTIDGQGTLVTPEGFVVKGTSGPIVFDETDREIAIREDGTVVAIVDGGIQEERGTISIVKFQNEVLLKEAGNGLYTAEETPIGALETVDFKVVQGALEGSNVNAVTELTNMIAINRSVGLTSKFLGDVNELQRKAISTLSRPAQ